MADPTKIQEILEAVTIPVMAKARIGHFAEARVLQALEVDYIDESEVLTPADEEHHIDKCAFDVPFVCGCRDLGEALRGSHEGAAMIRTKGEAGTGDREAVRHMRAVFGGIRRLGVSRPMSSTPRRSSRRRRARALGGRERTAPGRDLHRRWHRDPGRRRALHAARRGRRLRRLRDLQERRPGLFVGKGDRRVDHALPTTPEVMARVSPRAWASRCAASTPPRLAPEELLETRGW